MLASQSIRQLAAAARLLAILTLVLGLAYPAVIAAAGAVVAPGRTAGSKVQVHGRTVGSARVGQSFTGPTWFHPRPSAAGDGYDTLASGASNLGPSSEELVAAIRERREAYAALNGVAADAVPADALTASASGLDPDISPENARLQAPRVAQARGLDRAAVLALVADLERGRALGFLGAPAVNVLELNLRVEALGEGRNRTE